VTCSEDGEWAAASVAGRGIDEVAVLEAQFTSWVVVDRPGVCTGHNVPADFYRAACGSV
jgi:hypothetical protein